MRILVTGGLGFIGSALIRQLINHTDHEVLNIDKETYAAMPESLNKIKNEKNYNFEKIDITASRSLQKIFQNFKPSSVIHLAAESHVDRSITGPEEFINTKIQNYDKVLEKYGSKTNYYQEKLTW